MASFYRATACNAMHGIAKGFCPSVKHVDCDNMKDVERCATFLNHIKDNSS